MTSLQNFLLDSSRLQGTLPTEIEAMANIQMLSVTDNALTGTLPSQLGRMTTLQSLYVDGKCIGTVDFYLIPIERNNTHRVGQLDRPDCSFAWNE